MIELDRTPRNAAADAVRIKVIGIGGAGGNALDRIVLDGIENAEVVAMNTDVQALTASVATQKVQLGRNATRGLGAGGDPELGITAAEESVEEIREAIEGAGMVILCAGLGGGTGSGTAPLVARISRDLGALVIVFATMPFSFEGRRRASQAEESLAALQQLADVVICFENDRMGESVSPKAGIHQAFATADQTISQSVRAVCEIVQGQGLISIGFDDLRSAIGSANTRALFGCGIAEGANRAHEALERALKNPLMERGRLIDGAESLLVSVNGGTDMTLADVQVLMDALGRYTGESTRILFGVGVDPKLGNRMSVTLLSALAREGATYLAPRPAMEPPKIPEPVADYQVPEPEPECEPEAAAVEQMFEVEEPAEPELEEVPVSELTEPEPEPAPVTEKPKPTQEQQATLEFEPLNRGRFEKSEPTIVDGQDLDVPTFLRRNVRIK